MPFTFDEAKAAFRDNRIRELSHDPDGLRFLKLRSLSRAEYMQRLILELGIPNPGIRGEGLLRYLYDQAIPMPDIERIIRLIYAEQREERRQNEDQLVSELYRLQAFDWGGLHQNSLEKTIVDNYVKRIRSFDHLNQCIENELHHSMRSYVLCSWYNHWTSIIIEDIFKDNPNILPAIGLIKKIDFFWHDVPFDLKVTYIPEGFIKDRRRQMGLSPELTLLKRFCRRNNIHFDRSLPEGKLLEDLWKKVEDHPSADASALISELRGVRLRIINEVRNNPEELIVWLYENQGVRRFDSSNRLFLILIDYRNFFDSWKLKRAKPLLVDRIHSHLSATNGDPGHEISFSWEGQEFAATSDIIFVVHEQERVRS